jgi:hypothetical protein
MTARQTPPDAALQAMSALWAAPLVLLGEELRALGQLMPCHGTDDAAATEAREHRHADAVEEAFDDVPV